MIEDPVPDYEEPGDDHVGEESCAYEDRTSGSGNFSKLSHPDIMGTIRDKEEEMIAQQALALLDKEYHLGKYQYPNTAGYP